MSASERDLLRTISQRSRGISLDGAELLVGPGDDCAVVRLGSETLLVTVDQLVEGRHYTPGTPLDLVARKAVARSISDIAAMGGAPVWSTATGLLPSGFDSGDQLFGAMKRCAEHWGAPLIGGDIAFGSQDSPGPMVLTTTVFGRMDCGEPPILRTGAQPGDGVWVSGPIGGSFASGRHLTFEPRLGLGRGASAMIDVSDGLGIDADRVARASGVRIEIDASLVPLHHGSDSGTGGWRRAFADGEDYELLACSAMPLEGFARIGRVVEGEPGAAVLDGETETPAGQLGWDHGRSVGERPTD